MAKTKNDISSNRGFSTEYSWIGKLMRLADAALYLRKKSVRDSKIFTYESPIEFVYDDTETPEPVAGPTEI